MKLQKHTSASSQLKYIYFGVSSLQNLLSSRYVPNNILEIIERLNTHTHV